MRRSFGLLIAAILAGCSSQPPASQPEPQAQKAPDIAPPPSKADKPDNRKVLVVFGDSLSAGYGLEAGQSYPDDLQKKLDAEGYAWRVVNLGISGDTTEGGVSRMESATSLKPAIVLLELGGNDGLRGLPLSVTRKNLDTMIATFQKAGAKVVLAGITLPPNYGPDYVKKFDTIYSDLAHQYHLTFLPFLLVDIVTKDLRYLQKDGIHPTAEGAEIVSGTVFKTLKPLLK